MTFLLTMIWPVGVKTSLLSLWPESSDLESPSVKKLLRRVLMGEGMGVEGHSVVGVVPVIVMIEDCRTDGWGSWYRFEMRNC